MDKIRKLNEQRVVRMNEIKGLIREVIREVIREELRVEVYSKDSYPHDVMTNKITLGLGEDELSGGYIETITPE